MEVIITRIKIIFDYSDWKLMTKCVFKMCQEVWASTSTGTIVKVQMWSKLLQSLKNQELILKWKKDILTNDSRNISWHGWDFCGFWRNKIFFPLESLKNICEPPQISVVKYEELGRGGVVVCVCCILYLN